MADEYEIFRSEYSVEQIENEIAHGVPQIQEGTYAWKVWDMANQVWINTGIVAKGESIVSIVKTSTSGLVDTYTITYSGGGTSTFNITNGAKGDTGNTGNGISTIAKTSTSGNVDTYTITYTSGSTTTFTVTNGASNTIHYTTTAPTSDNVDGIKVVILNSEPATRYNGWLYIIQSV